MTTKGKDRQADVPEPARSSGSGPARAGVRISVQNESAVSTSRLKALTDLDAPDFEVARRSDAASVQQQQPEAPPPTAANDNDASRRARAEQASTDDDDDAFGAEFQRSSTVGQNVASGRANTGNAAAQPGADPDVSTRAHTHVPPEAWFDVKLDALGAPDPRQALAWRFEAALAAHALLVPTAPTPEARELLMSVLRRYEKRVRSAAGSRDEHATQTTLALHALLNEAQLAEIEPFMSELEVTLLTLDECLPDDAFRRRFSKQHVAPKQLLQYARLLASRGFGIGYLRDRFELIARELLTTRLASGKLLLASRKRSGTAILRLTRGLARPRDASEERNLPISYLRDSLDRLQSLSRAAQFFDSGFYVDVYGYKISKHACITSPEFLYLCVAVEVEVHNRLLNWSQGGAVPGKPSAALAGLQAQLQSQHDAAQAVFPGFHRPLAGSDGAGRAAKKARRTRRAWSLPRAGMARFVGASALVLGVLAANLYVLDFGRSDYAIKAWNTEEAKSLSPVLLSARLMPDGTHFVGKLSRPVWNGMTRRQRQEAAEQLAQTLKSQGIEHAEVLAYKTRAIQIEFGSVVFVDAGR